jgi:hypothetical protein
MTYLDNPLRLDGGTIGAAPTPQIKFANYYDNTPGPSVSHIDLYNGTYGFGISLGDLDYISDGNIDSILTLLQQQRYTSNDSRRIV